MSALFSALKINDVTFKNRMGLSPLCQYQSNADGFPSDWHMVHLGSRAVGGVGLIFTEATAVEPAGRISPQDAGLWSEAQAEAYAPIVAFQKQFGAVPGIQVAHAGRKASSAVPWGGGAHLADADGGWETYGPTDQVFDPDGTRLWRQPNAMTQADIDGVQDQFVNTAKLALDAGYEVLEIHAAHGYLLQSFLTPLVNTRTDKYGGSAENRARMLMETLEKVKQVWPERLVLAVRISIVDWVDDGLQLEDSIQLAKWLKDAGVDMIDCSGGGATPDARASIGSRTEDQPGLTVQLTKASGLAAMAVGGIRTPEHANQLIEDGIAIALLGRELMRDPYWPYRAAAKLGVDTKGILAPHPDWFIGAAP